MNGSRPPVIRPFRSSDLDSALAANDAVGWSGRRVLFDYYSARDDCALFVAEVNGEIVGTGGGRSSPVRRPPDGYTGSWCAPASSGPVLADA
jgi:hypothetical protein